MEILNRLKETREREGVSAAELAERVGVSRQTVHAIEAGSYVPNTAVALRMARELGTPVEELFALEEEAAGFADAWAEPLGECGEGRMVRLARVGSRAVAAGAGAERLFFEEADGVVEEERRGRVRVRLAGEGRWGERVVVSGCDPGLSQLVRALAGAKVEVVLSAAASAESLRRLKEGRVHIAGAHLRDGKTGEWNVAAVKKALPRAGVCVVTFASWQEGLAVRAGNPKGIHGVADVARKGVRVVNRQKGAGSRELLDRSLRELGIAASLVAGYGRIAEGHLPAAAAVARGEADCCVTTEAAARAAGLAFVPLAVERFDLVTLERHLETPGVAAVFDALQRAGLRGRLRELAGYDVSETGERRV